MTAPSWSFPAAWGPGRSLFMEPRGTTSRHKGDKLQHGLLFNYQSVLSAVFPVETLVG